MVILAMFKCQRLGNMAVNDGFKQHLMVIFSWDIIRYLMGYITNTVIICPNMCNAQN